MELLSKNIKKELKEFVSSIKGRKISIQDIEYIVSLLKKDKIYIMIDSKSSEMAITKFFYPHVIVINPNLLIKDSKVITDQQYEDFEGEFSYADIFNLNIIHNILHEVFHQKSYAYFENKELDLYYKEMLPLIKKEENKYLRRWKDISFEHAAESFGSFETIDLYDEELYDAFLEYVELFFISNVMEGYIPKGNKVTSPYEKTLKVVKAKKSYTFDSLDLKTRLFHGLPISSLEYSYLDDYEHSNEFVEKVR